ncbi:MAG: sodium/proline symporter [Gammaproteobacteria bacterium AqS3]|nr:sodium/proline symporter [Gammaproteobacteria bacterium AqS3]
MQSTATVVVFGFYLLALAGIAYYGWLRTHNISDYVLGGRSLSPFAAAMSSGASNMSAWLMLSVPALVYFSSTEAFLIAGGLLLGQYVSILVVAPRLRVYSERLNDSQTLPIFFANRTGRTGRDGALLRGICSLILLVFMLLYVASGLVAGGELFMNMFDVSLSTAVIMGALVIGAYTLIGGFLAISWTDVLQALMMLMILIVLPLIILSTSAPDPQQQAGSVDFPPLLDTSVGWILVISSLAWGLGYIGLPHSVMRYKAIRSVKGIPFFRRTLISWSILVFIGSLSLGLAARAWYVPAEGASGEDLTLQMLGQFFNPWVAGLALAAIMAAVMSTADSQLLLASVSISEDLIAPLRPDWDSDRRLWIGRITVLLIMGFSLSLALQGGNTILSLVSYAWAGLGAAFGPVMLFALYWRKFNYIGAIAGVSVGGVSTILLQNFPPIEGLYELLPAFALSALAIWLCGRFAPQDQAAEEVFDRLEAEPLWAESPAADTQTTLKN